MNIRSYARILCLAFLCLALFTTAGYGQSLRIRAAYAGVLAGSNIAKDSDPISPAHAI